MTAQSEKIARLIAGLTLALIVAASCLPLDVPSRTRLASYLWDLLHLPAMALAVCCAAVMLPAKCGRGIRRVALAAGGVVILALAMEWLQPRWGRERDVADIVLGAAGIVIAAAGLVVWPAGSLRMRRVYLALAAVIVMMALAPAMVFGFDRIRVRRSFPLLAGFEDLLELGRWDTRAVRVVRAADQATEGRWSARVEVTDGVQEYPGLFLVEGPCDWTGMKALCADIRWPEGQGATLWVRVDDRRDQPPYGDRFQKELALKPGIHRICIGRKEMGQTPGGRALDLSRVARVGFFLYNAGAGDHFHVDNVRLEMEGL